MPLPLILGEGFPARFLLALNTVLLMLFKGLFSFQSVLVVQPQPTLDYLLEAAKAESRRRREAELPPLEEARSHTLVGEGG